MTSPLRPEDIELDDTRPDVPKRAVFVELGSGGLRKTGGYLDGDFLPELNGLTGAKKYTEMSSNDPVLSSLIFALTMLLRNAKWRIEPADTNDASTAARDWLEEELFKKMETSWADVIAEISSMFIYGYSPMEVTYILRDEGDLGVRKIALRMQETVFKWAYDEENRELVGLWQMDYEHPMIFIPLQKLLLFRTTTAGGTPEGRSLLRGSYVTWVRKKAVEEAEGRASMRAAGVVVLRVPGQIMMGTASPEEKLVFNSYKAIAERLAQDRQGAMVLPSDIHPESKAPIYSLEYVVADGRRSNDMSPIIERMDKRMASTVLADFILLGQQAVGSFALSSDKTDLFATALGGWMKQIVETFNRQLIKPLWELNGFPDETMPKVAVGDVEDRSLAELGTFIKDMSTAGMALFPNPELEDYLLEAANLPEISDETRKRLEEATAAQHAADVAGGQSAVAEAAATKATAGATVRHRGMPLPKSPADGRPARPARGRVAKRLLPFFEWIRKFNPAHYGPGAKGGQFAPKGASSLTMDDFSEEAEASYGNVIHLDPVPATEGEEIPSRKELRAYRQEVAKEVEAVFGTREEYESYVQEMADHFPGFHFEVETNLGEKDQLLVQVRGNRHGERINRDLDSRLYDLNEDSNKTPDLLFERQFVRTADGELVVRHDRFMLAKEFQGQGTGAAVTRASFERYKQMGVSRVTIYANVDVGAYAWARMGFVPIGRDWAVLADKLDHKLTAMHDNNELSGDGMSALRKVLKPDGRLFTSDPKALWKIADARLGDMNIGKKLLAGIGNGWHGRFELESPDSWDRMMASTEPRSK